MCKMSNYPGLYSKANEILRKEGINSSIPGYEFLRRAIVICKIDKIASIEKLVAELKEAGIVIPANKDLDLGSKSDRDSVEQWMIEAMKGAGIDTPLMEYIKQLASELGP